MRNSKRATWKRQDTKSATVGKAGAAAPKRGGSLDRKDESQMRVTLEPLLDFLDENFHLLSDNLYEVG